MTIMVLLASLRLCAFMPSVRTTQAATTFLFEGIVVATVGFRPNPFTPGQIIAGTYTIDASTADVFPADPFEGRYLGAVTQYSFDVGGIYVASGYSGDIRILNDNPNNNRDSYIVSFNTSAAPPLNGAVNTGASLILHDNSRTALASYSLPAVRPDLADFPIQDFLLGFTGHGSAAGGVVQATITSLTSIPEPSSILLAVLGMSWLGCHRRFERGERGVQLGDQRTCL